MEIIKRGQPKNERKYVSECYSCKTIFRFGYTEAKLNHDSRDGDFLSINCPVCAFPCTLNPERYEKPTEGQGLFGS